MQLPFRLPLLVVLAIDTVVLAFVGERTLWCEKNKTGFLLQPSGIGVR
jgi:hypothetical protein